MWKLPIGAIVQPMHPIVGDMEPIPIINFGRCGVQRCRNCRTYINPFVSWADGGRRWRCNVCGTLNEVPQEYFGSLDANNQRTDIDERPELTRGTVEFVAPQEYMVRPPQPPVYVFVIDVSYNAVASGMVHKTCETILQMLDNLPGAGRTRIGFITFDNTVHFYNLKATLSQPQVLVVPDINNIFLPLPDDMLVNLQESRLVVTQLLEQLPSMYQQTQVVEACMGSALEAAFQVMHHIGGKMCLFQSTLPTVGLGRLKNREDPKVIGTEGESKLLCCQDEYYRGLANRCSRQQICVDAFLFSSQFTDIASIGFLPKFTGGQVYYYPGFTAARDSDKFCSELMRCLSRETAFEAVMRIRMSKGFRVSSYYGNFFNRSSDLLALPNCDSDKAFGVQIALEEQAVTASVAYMQTALLYTTSGGERRIRVHTLQIPISGQIADLFQGTDQDAMICLMSKISAEKAVAHNARGLKDARDFYEQRCCDTFRLYRSLFPPQHKTPDRLLVPNSLDCMPIHSMAMMKSAPFRPGTGVRLDEKVYLLLQISSMPIATSASFSYPRMYALHKLAEGDFGTRDAHGNVKMPTPLRLSADQLSPEGAFLIEDGIRCHMFLGKLVNPVFINQVFGLSTLEGVDGSSLALPHLESDLSSRINNMISHLRQNQFNFQQVSVAKEGEARAADFIHLLVEDRINAQSLSYADFLCHIHRGSQSQGPSH
jgi:protein transport protein SEC24